MSEEQSKLSEEQRKVIEESDEFHPYDCELNFTVKFSLHRDKEPTEEETYIYLVLIAVERSQPKKR